MDVGKALENTVNQISRIAGIIAIVCLTIMIVLSALNVLLRFVFNYPIRGCEELITYLMIVAGFFGLAWCAVKESHVSVDMIIKHFSPRSQAIIDSITFLLALTVVPIVAWQGFAQAGYAWIHKTASSFLGIPDYPFLIVLGLGFVMLFLVLILKFIKMMVIGVRK